MFSRQSPAQFRKAVREAMSTCSAHSTACHIRTGLSYENHSVAAAHDTQAADENSIFRCRVSVAVLWDRRCALLLEHDRPTWTSVVDGRECLHVVVYGKGPLRDKQGPPIR